MTTSLPTSVREVTPPDLLPVSRLSLGISCPLALALSCTPDVTPLPVHPRASYGRIFHLLLEKAARGEIGERPTLRSATRTALNDLVEACRRGELKGFSTDIPSPEEVFGLVGWRQKASDTVAIAVEVAERSGRSGPRAQSRTSHEHAILHHTEGQWAEVPLTSRNLRVRGRADLVERSVYDVHVMDLKTGNVLTANAEVHPDVAMQLRVYGLVVAEQVPSVQVRLSVESHYSTTVSFNESDRRATIQTLRELSKSLPSGRAIDADALARPGAACTRCAMRHRCRSYLREAPMWWSNGTQHLIPPDVWGTVRTVSENVDDSCTIDLEDAAGRYVRLHTVRSALVGNVDTGDTLFAFGLNVETPPRRGDLWYAPANYYDINRDTLAVAWTLTIFVGEGRTTDEIR